MSEARAAPLLWSAAPALAALPADDTYVFAFSLQRPAALLTQLERLLSRDERDRADRFVQPRDRRRWVVGRAQLRVILGHYLNAEPQALSFRYGSHHKPALQGARDHARIQFNLSRSHEVGVLAIQWEEDIGVDVERIRPFVDALDIARRFFAREEHAALRSLPPSELDAAFFSYWTRKEAVLKSLGLGITQRMDGFALPLPGAAAEQIVVPAGDGPATRWSAALAPPAEQYVAALATAGPLRALRCWSWSERSPSHA